MSKDKNNLENKNGKKSNYTIELFDKYCPNTNITSMARTTGYTASIALRMVADGLYSLKGISPPEYMGKKPECMNYLLKELKKRNIKILAIHLKGLNMRSFFLFCAFFWIAIY